MADLFKPLHDLFFFVSELPTSIELRESQYVWSLFEVAHVVSMCLFAGLIIMMDLRLLGIGNMQSPFSQLQKRLFPWQMLGMALSANIFFWLKMLMMVIAGVNAMAFHYIAYFSVDSWDNARVPPLGAKLAGALGVALWGFVIIAGRLIPYNWFQNN
jgi:hypothetical protein